MVVGYLLHSKHILMHSKLPHVVAITFGKCAICGNFTNLLGESSVEQHPEAMHEDEEEKAAVCNAG